MKYKERVRVVNAVQFHAAEPWPAGVYHLEDWMIESKHNHPKSWEGIVAFIYESPDPYLNFLHDGDWIVEHEYDGRVHAMSNNRFIAKYEVDDDEQGNSGHEPCLPNHAPISTQD